MPAEIDQLNLTGLAEDKLGLGLENRLSRINRGSSVSSTPTATGTREVITPGVSFTSNDPLQGTIFEKGAILGLDPLGIFDIPQITVDLERLDPDHLTGLVSEQARENALKSIALEQELDPTVAAAREEAIQHLLADIESGGTLGADLEEMILGLRAGDVEMPGLERSELLDAARSRALEDLGLGGELPPEIRNLVARNASEAASGGGFLGGGIGRDIVARDLGLTGLDLRRQRLATASGLGAGEEAANLAQQGLAANIALANEAFKFDAQAGATQALANLRQQEFANRFGTAQFTQGIDRPVAGLDPGDLASFVVGDINLRNELVNRANVAQLAATQQAKEAQLDLFGDIFGGTMSLFGG